MSFVIIHSMTNDPDITVIGNKNGKPFKTRMAAAKSMDEHYDSNQCTKDDSFDVHEIQAGLP